MFYQAHLIPAKKLKKKPLQKKVQKNLIHITTKLKKKSLPEKTKFVSPARTANFSKFLPQLGKNSQAQGAKFLNILSQHKDFISIDQNDKVIIGGTILPNSNFGDILEAAFGVNKNLEDTPGANFFFNTLKVLNIPAKLVRNKVVKNILK